MSASEAQNSKSINDCDNNASPSEEDSCQFLKCKFKETESPIDTSTSTNTIANSVNNVNKHAILKRTTNKTPGEKNENSEDALYSSQDNVASNNVYENGDNANANNKYDADDKLIVEQAEDGIWILRWKIKEQRDDDFIALCWAGMFINDIFKLMYERM